MAAGTGAQRCHVCAAEFTVDGAGIARHLDPAGDGIDPAADSHHVPYELDDQGVQ